MARSHGSDQHVIPTPKGSQIEKPDPARCTGTIYGKQVEVASIIFIPAANFGVVVAEVTARTQALADQLFSQVKRDRRIENQAVEIVQPERAIACAVKVSEVTRMLQGDGWFLVATRGSHRQFKHATKPGRVTVPGKPSDDLAPGTLNSIFKQAGLK